jgi:hypothetical protein
MEMMGRHHPYWQAVRKPIAHKKITFIHNKWRHSLPPFDEISGNLNLQ